MVYIPVHVHIQTVACFDNVSMHIVAVIEFRVTDFSMEDDEAEDDPVLNEEGDYSFIQ